ncbi:MAG: hypothetical protein E7311_05460 [Clostridiales bacterium]|nr:hypothetical protein [Clostridiales bacterium]
MEVSTVLLFYNERTYSFMNKMDTIGFKGFDYFSKHYGQIWDNYIRYGITILDVDLDESESEIRNIFLNQRASGKSKSVLLRSLLYLWQKKYQMAIYNCKTLAHAYQIIKKKSDGLVNISREPIYVGKKERVQFYITPAFFEKLKNHKNNFVFFNGYIYEIKIDDDFNTYIVIEKEIAIKDALTD